jgi:hypothetical protein
MAQTSPRPKPAAAAPGDAVARDARRLATLLEISQALSGTLNQKAAFHRILEILAVITARSAASSRSSRPTASCGSKPPTASPPDRARSPISSARASPAASSRAASRSSCRVSPANRRSSIAPPGVPSSRTRRMPAPWTAKRAARGNTPAPRRRGPSARAGLDLRRLRRAAKWIVHEHPGEAIVPAGIRPGRRSHQGSRSMAIPAGHARRAAGAGAGDDRDHVHDPIASPVASASSASSAVGLLTNTVRCAYARRWPRINDIFLNS